MKQLKKIVFVLFLAISVFSNNVIAATSPFWGNLEPGPYKVGFKLINAVDYSRSSFMKYGRENSLQSHARGRQIRIYLWYPVSSSVSKPPVLFEKYANSAVEDFAPYPTTPKDIFEFVELPLVRGLSKEGLVDLLLKPAAAIKDAQEAEGSFPLVVFGQGLYYESPITHIVLCEYLASHGFVVATCPLLGTHSRLVNLDLIDLETQVRDMEFVLSQGCRLPFVDINRLGLMGFDLGSMSALLLQMRNADIDAFVSLDSGIMFEHNTRLLKQSPYYKPAKLCVPLMHITRTMAENQNMNVVEDHSLFESAAFADISLLRFKDMRHVDFTSYAMYGMDNMLPFYWGPPQGNPKPAYELLCRYVLNFLRAHLYEDKKSRTFLKSDPKDHAVPGVSLTIESKKGGRAPMEGDDFVNLVFIRGMDETVRKVREAKQFHPNSEILEEKNFINLGYRFLYFLGKKDYAVEVFKLYCEIHPRSANAYDSLAEAYMMNGNKKLAILNYQKSLELNPDNKNAAEKLKQLQQKKRRKLEKSSRSGNEDIYRVNAKIIENLKLQGMK
jgi:tetratricopeptide (TPR) repeat protein